MVRILISFLLFLFTGCSCLVPTTPQNSSIETPIEPFKDVQLSDIKIEHRPLNPRLPVDIKMVGYSWTVLVEITVDIFGNVISSKSIEGSPLLFKISEELLFKWKFVPHLVNNKPIPFRVKVPVIWVR